MSIPWLSRPGLYGLNEQLERHLPNRDGWFVEAGASDGFRPRCICIEVRHSHEAAVAACLSPWYRKVETLHQGTAHCDSLWARLDETLPT